MKLIAIAGLVLVQVFLFSMVSAEEGAFPGRAQYPFVKIISKAELHQKFDDVTIVDARSELEYQTLRIEGAINIPVADKAFEQKIQALRQQNPRPIVFYCNGRTCYKSYNAVELSRRAKVTNTFAYDAGMFEWVESYPEKSELLNKKPVNKQAIISTADFKQRLLEPGVFNEKIQQLGDDSLIVDVRDKYQRGAAGFFPGKEQWVSLDNQDKLKQIIRQAKKDKKTLFVYDEVGKQVRWLQYALEEAQLQNYYFMDKGAKGYYASMMKDFGFSTDRLK